MRAHRAAASVRTYDGPVTRTHVPVALRTATIRAGSGTISRPPSSTHRLRRTGQRRPTLSYESRSAAARH